MNFSFNDAYRIISNVIDERIRTLVRSGASIDYQWGTVASIDAVDTCSVYLGGDILSSNGFKFENGIKPNLLDPVRVAIDRRGNRWIESVIPSSTAAFPRLEIDVRQGQVRTGPGTSAPSDLTDKPGAFLASTWDNLSAGATYSLTAATEFELTGVAASLTTPTSGNFRIWFMGNLRWSHSVAAELEGWVRLRSGGTGGTALDIPNLQTYQMGAGEEASFVSLGWIDSANAGTPRAIAGLTNGITVTADWSIRASATGTATVYAAAANYVTNLHIWVTRL